MIHFSWMCMLFLIQMALQTGVWSQKIFQPLNHIPYSVGKKSNETDKMRKRTEHAQNIHTHVNGKWEWEREKKRAIASFVFHSMCQNYLLKQWQIFCRLVKGIRYVFDAIINQNHIKNISLNIFSSTEETKTVNAINNNRSIGWEMI